MRNLLKIAIAFIVIFSSCTNQEPSEIPDANADVYTIQLPSTTQNGKQTWSPGDQLVVHGEYTTDQISIILSPENISADGKTCNVKVSGVTPYEQKGIKAKYFIAYPGEMVANDNHCKDISKFNGTNALLLAGYNKNKTFELESVVGGFIFTVEGDFDSYDLKGNNDETVGYSYLSCRLTENTKIYAKEKGTPVSVISGDVTADGKTANHICFTGDTKLEDGVLMTFYKNGIPVKICYIEETFHIARNVFIDLGNLTSKLSDVKDPAADTHVSQIPKDVAVDLSAEESANCYLVNKPGVYSFKAVKGNSNEAIASIGSVEVLWETWGTTEKVIQNSVVAEVDFEKDVIYFRIAEDFHCGNAVIAAKNDLGAIIWSWHIWIPETTIYEGLYGLSRYMTMDRNLGALVAADVNDASPKSAGLFYQWGRKDPFVGIGDFSTGQPATVAGQEMTLTGGQISTARSIKNPTAFANVSDKGWNTTSDIYDKSWSSSKTQYDPCPVGYRVPYETENVMFTNSPLDLANWEYLPANNVFTVGSPVTTYPLGGYITTDGEYSQFGEGMCLWSSTTGSTASKAENMRVFKDNGEASYGNGGKVKSNGYAVRCVVYDETPFENASGTPVHGNTYEKYSVKIQELSGLCLNTDESFLWGVGDQGTLSKISFDGTVETLFSTAADMEGVTINHETGDLYIGCEPNYVFKCKAPEYKSLESVFTIPEAQYYENSGVEGIAWYREDMLLVGTQVDANLWAYKYEGLDEKGNEIWTKVWKKSMRGIAVGMTEVADISYDPVKDQIWIIDSNTHSVYLFNGDATEHLATYKAPYGGNEESVCLDYSNDCIWVANDASPSALYKVDFIF